MACGAEMILVKVIEDVTMPVPGFQRRAYMCSECNETEQRLAGYSLLSIVYDD